MCGAGVDSREFATTFLRRETRRERFVVSLPSTTSRILWESNNDRCSTSNLTGQHRVISPNRANIQTTWNNRSSCKHCPMNTSHSKMVCISVLTMRNRFGIEVMLNRCRYEHSGHSTPKARKPAAREQGCPEGTRTNPIETFESR